MHMQDRKISAGVVPYRRNSLKIAALIWFCLSGIPAFAQTLTVVRPSRHAQSHRLSDIRGGTPAVNGPTEIKLFRGNRVNGGESGKGGGTLPDPTIQTSFGPLINATPGISFDGTDVFHAGYIPSDSNIAVGPNHIVETVNAAYTVYSKTGALLFGPNSIRSLWTGLGGACSASDGGDPIVQYDRAADRWMITQLGSLSNPYSECIAISTSPDPMGSYFLYSYDFGLYLNDYPKFGIWPTATNSAYLASYSLFLLASLSAGSEICAYDRAAMLAGQPDAMGLCYSGVIADVLVPSDTDGPTPPLDGTPGYFLNLYSYSSLALFKMTPNFAAATATLTQDSIGIASFSEAPPAPQPGTTTTLDSLGDRLMNRLAFRRFPDHESMVVNHSVAVGSRSGVRWYELRGPVSAGAGFSPYQQGTYAPDNSFRWMGSAAMDKAGDIALGYSVSSSTGYPSVRYTGRTPTDPLGTMASEASLWEGAGSQTGYSRWGDYTSMQIDPSDDCTFWYVNEYLPTTHPYGWFTRIGSFKFSGCGAPIPDFSLSANPASVTLTQGNAGNSTITVSSVGGFSSSVALTVSGCPANATCTLSPASVTPPANGSAASTLTIATTASTAPGTYTLTINGNGSGHSTTVSLTVNPASSDFGISLSASTLTVNRGSNKALTVNVTKISGSSSVTLSVSGLPQKTNGSFSVNPVTAPGSSILTISANRAARQGNYTVTVTSKYGSVSHTAAFTLTIK